RQRRGVAGRERAAVAMRGAAADPALFDHPHAAAFRLQVVGAGQADHAATQDQYVGIPVHAWVLLLFLSVNAASAAAGRRWPRATAIPSGPCGTCPATSGSGPAAAGRSRTPAAPARRAAPVRTGPGDSGRTAGS